MKEVFIVIAFALCSTSTANAQDVAGDWQGTLSTGSVQLRLILHVTRDNNGDLKASLDSIDQGAKGIPVSSISLKNSKLKFEVAVIHGSYQGKLNADASKISGTWNQGEFFDLDFKRTKAAAQGEPKPASASDIDGAWMGVVDTGGGKFRVVFHITNTANGLTATMDSPDQGATGIPATVVARNGSSLRIEMKRINTTLESKISADLANIDGTLSQHTSKWPVILKRVTDVTELESRRPQNPVKPYPYHEEEVSYHNRAQSVTLSATLTIPPPKRFVSRSALDFRFWRP